MKTTNASYEAKQRYQNSMVAENYDQERFSSWLGKAAHFRELSALNYVIDKYIDHDSSVLDLPCGTGRLLSAYNRKNLSVFGAEISNEMLDIARNKFTGYPNYHFNRCEAENLPFPNDHFDYLVSFRLMCHLPRDARIHVMGEMTRVTRRMLVVNYHFDVKSPAMFLSKLLHRHSANLPYPLRERDLPSEFNGLGLNIIEIRKLSWYEQSSALIILMKGIK